MASSFQSRLKQRAAFTLLELLVVLSILALIAGLIIPQFTDVFERGRSASQSFSIADVSRTLVNYQALNRKFPEGWDTLLAAPTTSDSQPSALYSKLASEVLSPNTFLTTTTLSDDQVTSLNSAGVSHIFLHDSTSSPSDSGTARRHLGTGSGHDGTANVNTVVAIDKTAGSEGLSLLVNDFGLNPNKDISDTTLTRISANTYVVFGLGPKSSIVQSTIQEAPILEHTNSATKYSRALVVFEVPNTGAAKAKLVGVFGPDGRSKKVSMSDYNSQTVVPH